MSIHQLSVSFVDREDRLLLRLNTQDAKEFRFWLTRRLTLRLMPVLEDTLMRLDSGTAHVLAPDESARKIVSEFQHDSFLREADFQTPFKEEARHWPLGQEPMLVSEINMSFLPSGALDLNLVGADEDGEKKACQLQLQGQLVHGLVHLIRQCMDKAQWLGPQAAPVPVDAEPAAHQAPAYRH
jgi:hypothetical protein